MALASQIEQGNEDICENLLPAMCSAYQGTVGRHHTTIVAIKNAAVLPVAMRPSLHFVSTSPHSLTAAYLPLIRIDANRPLTAIMVHASTVPHHPTVQPIVKVAIIAVPRVTWYATRNDRVLLFVNLATRIGPTMKL